MWHEADETRDVSEREDLRGHCRFPPSPHRSLAAIEQALERRLAERHTRVRRHDVCEDVGILPNHRHDLVAAVVFQPVYVLQQLPIGGLFAVKAIIGVAFAVADLCPSEQLSQIAKELRA